eukprot:5512586-Pleurochrysis_carterae.AAC.2
MRLEVIYAHRCDFVHQIWCYCDENTPLLAVVAMDREATFRWMQAKQLDPRRTDDLSATHAGHIKAAVLAQLRDVGVACGLQPWELVQAVHVVKTLGQADDDYRQLATPTFVLRRGHLKKRYEKELKVLRASLRSDAPRLAARAKAGRTSARTVEDGRRQ